jgi:gluconolactonase
MGRSVTVTGGSLEARIFSGDVDHPEGLAVAPDGRIWTGGEEGQMYVVDENGGVTELARTGGASLGMAFGPDGACYVCNRNNSIVRVEPSGRWSTFADSVEGRPLRLPNFPVFGPDGSLFVSGSGEWIEATGELYRFDESGRGVVYHRGPLPYPNGLAIDASGEYLYVVLTARHNVVRIRLADGQNAAVENVCPQGSLAFMPDGLAFDAAGDLYVTSYASDCIHRIAAGSREPSILVDDPLAIALNRPTNCAFGGPRFDQLFVANLGGRHLSLIELGVRGQPLFGVAAPPEG